MKQILRNWEKATQELINYFLKKYFTEKDYEPDWYWIADEIGGTLFVNDYFFNLEDIVQFLRYEYTAKDMFAYYDYALDNAKKNKILINIQNWKKLK